MSYEIIPTLFLRGVDIKKITQDYHENYYSKFNLENIPKDRITLLEGITDVNSCYSENHLDRLFRYKNNSSRQVIFAYTNQQKFGHYFNRQDKIVGQCCDWCRQEIKEPVGIPYRKINKTILIPSGCNREDFSLNVDIDEKALIPSSVLKKERINKKDEKWKKIVEKILNNIAKKNNIAKENKKEENVVNRYFEVSIYYILDKFCTFNCALAYLKVYRHIDSIYKNKDILLLELFKRFYPKEKLTPSNFWKLLDLNGGSLTSEEFYNKKFHYRQTTNVVMVPVKVTYVKMSDDQFYKNRIN